MFSMLIAYCQSARLTWEMTAYHGAPRWFCCCYLHHLAGRLIDKPLVQKLHLLSFFLSVSLLFLSLSPHLFLLPPLTMLIYALSLTPRNKTEARCRQKQSQHRTGIGMDSICRERRLHKGYDLINSWKLNRHAGWRTKGNAASIYYKQYVMWQQTKGNHTCHQQNKTRCCFHSFFWRK